MPFLLKFSRPRERQLAKGRINMNRPVIDPTRTQTQTHHVAAHQQANTKPADAPWWQLYSILIITIGAGIVIAVNDPALLNNPIVLLIVIVMFFGFVLVWSSKHAREIEAEEWQRPVGQTQVVDEPQSTITQQGKPISPQ